MNELCLANVLGSTHQHQLFIGNHAMVALAVQKSLEVVIEKLIFEGREFALGCDIYLVELVGKQF